jgi:hypothetical protein
MAAEFILEFEGVTTKEYDAVNKTLGIDPQSGEGDGPDGLVALSPQRSPLPGRRHRQRHHNARSSGQASCQYVKVGAGSPCQPPEVHAV